MTALYEVFGGQDAKARDINQYRDLYRGGTVFDVKNGYGATGDGVTNDTTAVQAALDAADAAGGGIVYFPPGTYNITVSLTVGRLVSLRGAGELVTIIDYTASTGIAVDYPNPGAVGDFTMNFGFTISDMEIRTTSANSALRITNGSEFAFRSLRVGGEPGATGHGISLVDCFSFNFERVKIRNFPSGSGIYWTAPVTQSGNATIDGYVVSTCLNGITIDATGGHIIDSVILNNGVLSACSEKAINVTGQVIGLQVLGAHIEIPLDAANTGTGIYCNGTNAANLVFDGIFFWQVQTPANFTGTIVGLKVANVWCADGSHATPAAQIISAGASCSFVEVGHVTNSGYAAILSDSSDATTRRRPFAGAAPTYAQCSGTLTLTNSLADVAGATYTATPVVTETWLVYATFDINITAATAGLCTGIIDYDGGTVGGAAYFDPANGTGRASVSTVHVITGVTAASHTVKLRGQKANGTGTAAMQAANTRMLVYRVSG